MPKIEKSDLENALGKIDDDLLDDVIEAKIENRTRLGRKKQNIPRFRALLITAALLIAAAAIIPFVIMYIATEQPTPAFPTVSASAPSETPSCNALYDELFDNSIREVIFTADIKKYALHSPRLKRCITR